MNNVSSVQQHPATIDAYIRHGWSLVPIPAGTKGPTTKGWNLKENKLKLHSDLQTGHGIGLAHAYSGTMALDIDSYSDAAELLKEKGLVLDDLFKAPDAVVIDSSRPGHGKLLYKMPFGLILQSKKIIKDKKSIYELRCATATGLTVQDVLPPSIHPTTNQPYRWAGLGHWSRVPEIPLALLEHWQSLLKNDEELQIRTGQPINSSWKEIQQAVECIPADCSREEWINIGMALHYAGSQTDKVDEALHLWDSWSKTAPAKYPGEREIFTQWLSFRVDKSSSVKIGTLFHIAKNYGWVRPAPDVSAFFKEIPKGPETLGKSLRHPAPNINLDIFPKILSTRAKEISDGVGCDPIVCLFSGLAAVCGVVDARSRLELMPGFKVPPVLWLMTLGDPADKKSPGSRPMLSPLKDLESEDKPRYQKEFTDWEVKESAYAAAKKSLLQWAASPEAVLGAQAPFVPDQPKPPVPAKITISDITSQKMIRSASERPQGLLCYLDEMNSWINKITDKTSGEDRSAWVVAYESERYEMDRVGAGSIHCDNLAVSIYGNIQPDVFTKNLQNLALDGLLQRFLPGILRSEYTRLGNPIPEFMTTSEKWKMTLRTIYALPAQTYKLSPEAFSEYRKFQEWYESAKKDERLLMASSTFMTAFGKIEGLCGRIALIFHIIESPFNLEVSVELMRRAIDFIRNYAIPAYRYALSEFAGINTLDKWIADYIIQHADESTITLSELKSAARRQLPENISVWTADQIVYAAMHDLEKASWVARIDDQTKEHQHIAVWAINPSIKESFSTYRKNVIEAKQRQREHIYRLSPYEIQKVHGA